MRVKEQTLWKIKQLATRWLYLITLRCSSRLFSAITPSPPKKIHLRKQLNCSLLFGRGLDRRSPFPIGKVAEQKGRPDHTPEFAEGKVKPVLTAVRAEPAQNGRCTDAAGFD